MKIMFIAIIAGLISLLAVPSNSAEKLKKKISENENGPGNPLAWDYSLSLKELEIDREQEAVTTAELLKNATWQTSGLESYTKGPWITSDPRESSIARIEAGIKGILKTGRIRDGRLPGTMACMVWCFTHENSTFCKKPELEKAILEKLPRLNEITESWRGAEKHKLSRASATFPVWDLCQLLRANKDQFTNFPEDQIAELEKSVTASAQAMLKPDKKGSLWVWQTRQPWRLARTMTVMLAGYKLTQDEKFLEYADLCLKFLHKDVTELGGFRYSSLDPLPNVQSYMDQTIMELGNFYIHADDEKTKPLHEETKRLLERIKDNYIYRGLPAGTYDYSAVPLGNGLCKTLWHFPPNFYGPGVVAMATGSGANATIARYMSYYFMGLPGELGYGIYASLKISDKFKNIKPEPLPNKYIVKDDSIDGIRILDENYACVFNQYPGAPTIVGARTAEKPARRYLGWRGAYSTVLQAVRPEVGRGPWKWKEKGPYNVRNAFFNVGRFTIHGDRFVHKDWAAYAASYKLPRANNSSAKDKFPWQVQQLWFYHSKQLVGFVSITSLEEQKAPYIAECIQFNNLNNINTGNDKNTEIEKIGDKDFCAGDFRIKILEHNFPIVETTYCKRYCLDKPMKGLMGREIRLADNPTDNKVATYKSGEQYFALLNICEKNRAEEKIAVEKITNPDFIGLKIKTAKKIFYLVYRKDPGPAKIMPLKLEIPLDASVYCGDVQHKAWVARRHPSRDRKNPQEFYYTLPQYGLMVFSWNNN